MKKDADKVSKTAVFKEHLSKFEEKCKNVAPRYWINIGMWFVTLMLLLAVIVIAAAKTSIETEFSKFTYSDLIAGMVLTFSGMLIFSIIHIVSIKVSEKRKKGGK